MQRHVDTLRVTALAMVVLLASPMYAAEAPSPPPPMTKAYKVSVFDKPSKDPNRMQVAEGVFVFTERQLAFEEVPVSLREDFMARYREIFFATEVDPNGCFALRHLGSAHGSVAVLAPYGLVGWKPGASDTITGRLFQSPDSMYDLTLTVKGDRLEGTGNGSLGFRSGATLVEYFYGERLPDGRLTDCFREAAEIQEAGKKPAQ